MIKFNCLIHKETGTVIKYDDWKEKLEDNDYITINNYNHGPMAMILNDDFEIIYDSEFTYRELRNIYLSMNDKEICDKVRSIMEFIQEHDPKTVEKELDEVYKKRKNIESGVKNEIKP